jgi:Ner family transcriptional regulator
MPRPRKAPAPATDWDVYEITAQLKRRGLTVAELGRRNGYAEDSLRMVAIKPWPKAEKIVADALGLTPEDIWPNRCAERRRRQAA